MQFSRALFALVALLAVSFSAAENVKMGTLAKTASSTDSVIAGKVYLAKDGEKYIIKLESDFKKGSAVDAYVSTKEAPAALADGVKLNTAAIADGAKNYDLPATVSKDNAKSVFFADSSNILAIAKLEAVKSNAYASMLGVPALLMAAFAASMHL